MGYFSQGLDEEYDRQLHEFYGQYHVFVDLMCRVGFMKDFVNQELITLNAMLGYEAGPLHFTHFPKLWLEVYNTSVSLGLVPVSFIQFVIILWSSSNCIFFCLL
jgi:hypothetical protein